MNRKKFTSATLSATSVLLFTIVSVAPAQAQPVDQSEWNIKLNQAQSQIENIKGKAITIEGTAEESGTKTTLKITQNANKSSILTTSYAGTKTIQHCIKPTRCWVKIGNNKKWVKAPSQQAITPTIENLIPEEIQPLKGKNFNYTSSGQGSETFSYQITLSANETISVELTYSGPTVKATILSNTGAKSSYIMNVNAKPVKVKKPKKSMIEKTSNFDINIDVTF